MADPREEGRPGPEWCEDKLCSGYGGRHAGKHVPFLPPEPRKGLTGEAEARELEESLRKWGCSCSTLHPAQHDPQQYRDCAITALRWQIKEMLGPLWLERHDAALRERLECGHPKVALTWNGDELGGDIGTLYCRWCDDVARLRQAGEQMAEALERWASLMAEATYRPEVDTFTVTALALREWLKEARAALSSWRAARGEG